MEIKRNASRPSAKGQSEYFTGAVRIDPLFNAADPARAVGASVTFEPGARTAWHTHPLGQTLIVVAGCGWAQHEGGPVEDIRPGDVVWFPPGEKHWHGATATTAMTHIAIQERLDGKTVDWMEHVSDAQYRRYTNEEAKASSSKLTELFAPTLFVVVFVLVVFIAAEADFETRVIVIAKADLEIETTDGEPAGLCCAGRADRKGQGKQGE
jgi:quercetin dioxygenase-like cupin family protein